SRKVAVLGSTRASAPGYGLPPLRGSEGPSRIASERETDSIRCASFSAPQEAEKLAHRMISDQLSGRLRGPSPPASRSSRPTGRGPLAAYELQGRESSDPPPTRTLRPRMETALQINY